MILAYFRPPKLYRWNLKILFMAANFFAYVIIIYWVSTFNVFQIEHHPVFTQTRKTYLFFIV